MDQSVGLLRLTTPIHRCIKIYAGNNPPSTWTDKMLASKFNRLINGETLKIIGSFVQLLTKADRPFHGTKQHWRDVKVTTEWLRETSSRGIAQISDSQHHGIQSVSNCGCGCSFNCQGDVICYLF